MILVARRPNVLLHAELWGDDGWSWYPDAYRLGLKCLLIPTGSYLNTLQRLAGLAAQPLPLTAVPTFFACIGIVVQVLPAVFLISPRMDAAWPDRAARLAFALLYVLLPDNVETFGNLTNAPWNLALVALQVVMAAPPLSRWEWGFDAVVLALSGLSGPFCLLLAPVAGWGAWHRRDAAAIWRIGAIALTGAVQIGFILHGVHARAPAPLGAGPRMLAWIVATQVLAGAELGLRSVMTLPGVPWWQRNLPHLVVMGGGSLLAVAAFVRGSAALRGLVVFAALVLAAALISPQVSATVPQWSVLTHPPMGDRYFYFAILAWVAVLFTLAADRLIWLRGIGLLLLAVMVLWAVPHDFVELPMPHTDFLARARAFRAAPAGTRMEFPVVPAGLMPMVLVKQSFFEKKDQKTSTRTILPGMPSPPLPGTGVPPANPA